MQINAELSICLQFQHFKICFVIAQLPLDAFLDRGQRQLSEIQVKMTASDRIESLKLPPTAAISYGCISRCMLLPSS